MTDTFTPVPESELARHLAQQLEAYRCLLTRWQWMTQDDAVTCALGFLGGESLLVVADPARERLVLDVWVGNVPCTVEALLALLGVNFNAAFKTRVAGVDAASAVLCLEGYFPLEYGLSQLRALVQQALAAGAQRRGALGSLWRAVEAEPYSESLTA